MTDKWKSVIGLEVHLQLKTNTKIWCGCDADYDNDDINTHTCPICLGHPGTLPSLNKKVLNYAIKAALALNCKINEISFFDRKNYFYPDCPKNYQITQFEKTYAEKGFIDINIKSDSSKRIKITKVQIEEDTGKSIHGNNESYLNYNRASMPLLEIISEPDMESSEEAYDYLVNLKNIIKYTGISDTSMELGSLRCDANISVMKESDSILGKRVEVKNLNSFKAVARAIDYEINRQIESLENSIPVNQETRLWDDENQTTKIMRSKEEAMDYRYFPEPDLLKLVITENDISKAKEEMPESKQDKIDRFISKYNLPEYNALILTEEIDLAQYFEDVCILSNNPKLSSNWIMTEVLRVLKQEAISIDKFSISANDLATIIQLIDKNIISSKIAKELFEIKLKNPDTPENIVKSMNLLQVSDESEIINFIDEVIKNNSKLVEDYLNADENKKPRVLKGLIGQVMKVSKGKLNPEMVNKLIIDKLR